MATPVSRYTEAITALTERLSGELLEVLMNLSDREEARLIREGFDKPDALGIAAPTVAMTYVRCGALVLRRLGMPIENVMEIATRAATSDPFKKSD